MVNFVKITLFCMNNDKDKGKKKTFCIVYFALIIWSSYVVVNAVIYKSWNLICYYIFIYHICVYQNICMHIYVIKASWMAQWWKNLPVNAGEWVQLEKGMAIHTSILAWMIPWTEEPGGLQSKGSQRVRPNWATENICNKVYNFRSTYGPSKWKWNLSSFR